MDVRKFYDWCNGKKINFGWKLICFFFKLNIENIGVDLRILVLILIIKKCMLWNGYL